MKFDNFQKVKSFVKSLLLTFNLGEDKVHSSLIRYNRDVDVRFSFADSNNVADVSDAVDAMPYMGSGTRTGQALDYVADNTFKVANGARDGVPKIVVIITDGKSQDDVIAPSRKLRNMGVITFAVGVGNVNQAEIDEIAGEPSRAFVAANFDELAGIVLNDIQKSVCYGKDKSA